MLYLSDTLGVSFDSGSVGQLEHSGKFGYTVGFDYANLDPVFGFD